MKSIHLIVLLLIAIFTYGRLLADIDPNSASCIIDSEFSNTEHGVAPLNVWALAGSHAVIDSILTIDVTAIPDSITYESGGVLVPIPDAQSGDGFDNSEVFNRLIKWTNSNVDSVNVHTRILIPPGVYNFSDQIVMHSNISLKGAGSDLTELRFLIQSDPTSGTMTLDDCRKDAIQVNGSGELPHQRIHSVGIEDLKIIRIREGLSPREVKSFVGDHCTMNEITSYWGNNIAIRFGSDCWVTGGLDRYWKNNNLGLEKKARSLTC
jgi:hypothetical protein